MTNEEAIKYIKYCMCEGRLVGNTKPIIDEKWQAGVMAIKALEQESKIGHWLRMSDLSEQEDDRYKCSRCGNVVHHTNKMNLYTFNSWCGRCGSDNGRK